MDHTTLIAHGLSSCCHAGLLLWAWCTHGAEIYDELQKTETHIPEAILENEETKTDTAQQATFTEAKPVPAFRVSVPDRQAVQVAALPIAKLPDLDGNEMFEQALLEPIAQLNSAGRSTADSAAPLSLSLPQAHFDAEQLLKLPHEAAGKHSHNSRSSAAHDFVFVINIIIGNHYRKQWRKRYGKHFTNHDLQLLVQIKNSIISNSELIRGSGIKEFDQLLLAYLHEERISGPPIEDGQYPIVLKLH